MNDSRLEFKFLASVHMRPSENIHARWNRKFADSHFYHCASWRSLTWSGRVWHRTCHRVELFIDSPRWHFGIVDKGCWTVKTSHAPLYYTTKIAEQEKLTKNSGNFTTLQNKFKFFSLHIVSPAMVLERFAGSFYVNWILLYKRMKNDVAFHREYSRHRFPYRSNMLEVEMNCKPDKCRH